MNRYRIRNQFHEVEGEYSEKALLRRIDLGYYSGQEEVSLLPDGSWQKLGAHPSFYDAFLSRIYEGKYESPRRKEDSEKSFKKSIQDGTRHLANDGEEQSDSRQSGLNDHKPVGGTVQQSGFSDLFAQSLKSEKSLSKSFDLAAVPQGMDPLSVPLSSETRQPRQSLISSSKLRVAGLLVVLIGGSWILLRGSDPKAVEVNGKSDSSSILSFESPQKEHLSGGNSERVSSLIQDGIDYQGRGSIPHLLLSYRLLKNATSFELPSAELQGRLALSAALLSVNTQDHEKWSPEAERWIQAVRQTEPHLWSTYLAEAWLAVGLGDLSVAKKKAESALESYPRNAESLALLGYIYEKLGDLNEARRMLEESTQNGSGLAKPRLWLAKIYLAQKDIIRAKGQCFEVLKLNAFEPEAYVYLAEIVDKQSQLQEARQLYELATHLAKFSSKQVSASAWKRLANLYALGGDSVKAGKAARVAVAYGDDLGNFPDSISQVRVSGAEIKETIQKNEYDAEYLLNEGHQMFRQSKQVEAMQTIEASYILEPSNPTFSFAYAQFLEARITNRRELWRVVGLYESVLESKPDAVEALVRLGMLMTDQYELAKGYDLLVRAEQMAPDEGLVHLALGKHYFRRQDYKNARMQLDVARSLGGDVAETNYYLGLTRLKFSNLANAEAEKLFFAAYSVNPTHFNALVAWLKLKVAGYEKRFAVRFVNGLLEKQPNQPKLLWALGEVYAADNQHRQAISYFKKSIEIDGNQFDVRMSLGKSHEVLGETVDSIYAYWQASSQKPIDGDGFMRAGQLLNKIDRPAEAEKVLTRLIEFLPKYPGAYQEISVTYQKLKNEDKAVEMMAQEVENNPQNPKYITAYGELLTRYKKYAEATSVLSRISSLYPAGKVGKEFDLERISAYLLMAKAFRMTNNLDSANASIQLAIKIDPEDPRLQREAGYIYRDSQRVNDAVAAFKFYLERNPAAQDADEIKNIITNLKMDAD